jgi:hypothetical protein
MVFKKNAIFSAENSEHNIDLWTAKLKWIRE